MKKRELIFQNLESPINKSKTNIHEKKLVKTKKAGFDV